MSGARTHLDLVNESVEEATQSLAGSIAAREAGRPGIASALLQDAIFARDVAIAALVVAEEEAKGGAS